MITSPAFQIDALGNCLSASLWLVSTVTWLLPEGAGFAELPEHHYLKGFRQAGTLSIDSTKKFWQAVDFHCQRQRFHISLVTHFGIIFLCSRRTKVQHNQDDQFWPLSYHGYCSIVFAILLAELVDFFEIHKTSIFLSWTYREYSVLRVTNPHSTWGTKTEESQ